MTDAAVRRALDMRAAQGRPARFWLRDDDAVMPSAALDRLLGLTEAAAVPLALAVIPAGTGQALADRLAGAVGVSVAVHGWAHLNHAGAGEKKQELGAHRPVAGVLPEAPAWWSTGPLVFTLAALGGAISLAQPSLVAGALPQTAMLADLQTLRAHSQRSDAGLLIAWKSW